MPKDKAARAAEARVEQAVAQRVRAFRKALRKRGPDAALRELAAPLEGMSPPAAAEYRRRVTRDEPLAFALLYLRRHLRAKDDGAPVTLSEVHTAWGAEARTWLKPLGGARGPRRAYLAPRSMGKSTWWFLVLPLWAAAHGHARFIAAFADTATQAEGHLASFKSELEKNVMLRADFPDLCAPKRRRGGVVVADNQGMLQTRSDFVFTARGVDSGNLGLKVDDRRPDLIVCDDLEPGESNYSAAQAKKRLTTLLDDILPLNVAARVVLVGTTTMSGGIADNLRQHYDEAAPAGGRSKEDPLRWVDDEHFDVTVSRAIATDDDGEPRSVWPEKWPLDFLLSIRHTRQYAKNYGLSPLGADGDYWTLDDFTRGALPGVTRRVLSLDPAVTTKKSSDYTGVAVVAWKPPAPGTASPGQCLVEYAAQVRLGPDALRKLTLRLIDEHDVGLVLVEVNQGGELWRKILWGVPKLKTIHQSVKKEVRAASVLNHYQRGRVIHAEGLGDLEAQQVAFPAAAHDDMVDAVGSAVAYFLDRKRRGPRVAAEIGGYA